MIQDLESADYHFLELLSDNINFLSWKAKNKRTGKFCFLKCSPSDTDLLFAHKFLSNSYDLQNEIKHPQILTALSKKIDEGRCFIEYPYLDSKVWKQLTIDTFIKNPVSIVTQVSFILDFLHCFNLVHCDIKFDNFSINANNELKLVDLDFIVLANSNPKGLIIGTPTFISPEIKSNDIIIIQSDNYSLGRQLEKVMGVEKIPVELKEKFGKFTRLLVQDDPWNRPANLIDTMYQCQLIDESTYRSLTKKLFLDIIKCEIQKLLETKRDLSFEDIKSVLNRKNMFIPSLEIISNALSAAKKDEAGTINLLLAYLDKCEVIRLESYWHIKIEDSLLFQLLSGLKLIFDRRIMHNSFDYSNKSNPDKKYDMIGKIAAEDDEYFRLFATQKVIDNYLPYEGEYNSKLMKKQIHDFTQQAIKLNRLKLSLDYYEVLDKFGDLSFENQLDRMKTATISGDVKYAKGVLEKFDHKVEDHTKVNIYKAWFMILEGQIPEADKAVEKILSEPTRNITSENYITALYVKGCIAWMKGEYSRASNYLSTALSKARTIKYDIVPICCLLAIINLDMGNYNEVIKISKLAIRETKSSLDMIRVQSIYIPLGDAYVRTANYAKANYWFEKYNSLQSNYFSKIKLVSYLRANGYLLLNNSRFMQSKKNFFEAIKLSDEQGNFKNKGKIFYNLTALEMEAGNYEKSNVYYEEAIKIFTGIKDDANKCEIEAVYILNNYFNNKGDVKDIYGILDNLKKYNTYYTLSICMFYIALHENELVKIRERIKSLFQEREYLASSDVPLFKALYKLGHTSQITENSEVFIDVLKDIYRIFMNASYKFIAAAVAMKLAELCETNNKHKQALNYLNEARKNYTAIYNNNAVERIDQKLAHYQSLYQKDNSYLEHLSSISKIIKDIDNYGSSLDKLLEFAVNQTGAERGVLFRYIERDSRLQVVATVNCSVDSLDDIKDFSLQVPRKTSEDLKALIIANALDDRRTKKYESIIQNNILSIISVPITFDDQVIGVLYLDHHTIPGLFKEEDVLFIDSISNVIAVMLNTIIKYKTIKIQKEYYKDIVETSFNSDFISHNAKIKLMLEGIPSIANSNRPVLITGESGTGKEILAKMIHDESQRCGKPYLKINCSAMAPTMIESELFGVAQNVATGVNEREGKLSAADSGTLLFDEIGDMSYDLQAKLLRAVEYQEFEKVGSNRTIYTDIRFLYATNKNLKELIKAGNFRADLFYRISTFTINIPPLRDRKDDIELLIRFFISKLENHIKKPVIAVDALKCLIAYDWPGNVRELKGVIDSLCFIYKGANIDKNKLPEHIKEYASGQVSEKENLIEIEKIKIENALRRNNWNQLLTSRYLRMPNSTLRYKIKKFNIKKI